MTGSRVHMLREKSQLKSALQLSVVSTERVTDHGAANTNIEHYDPRVLPANN